jgi:CubicO group peptidase (beta-lactamase class C family)
MFKKVLASFIVVVATLFSSVLAQTLDTQQLDTFVTQMMKDYGIPGVGLAIVENGQLSYAKGYGVRDVVTNAPVTPDTAFPIGSVTKSFTALGMMILVNDGLVDLDAPITTYIPEFKLSDPESTKTVTVRNLLTHTTGLIRTDASSFDTTITTDDIIAAAATTPLVGKPGEVFVYSNVNAILAGEIIERVSGESWEDFTVARILKPLKMDTTTLSAQDLKKQSNIATPSILDVRNGGLQTTDYLTLGADAPAGAINASTLDMVRYVAFQLGDGAPMIPEASLDEMHKGQIAAPDFNLPGIVAELASMSATDPTAVPPSLVPDEQYGYFWAVDTFLGETLVQHGGTVIGGATNVTLLPKQNSGIVILVNADANYFIEVLRLHIAELLLVRSDLDVNATLQAQLKVLGQDNAKRNADLEAARSYQPKAGELDALTGTYESLADPEPTRVEIVNERELELESGFQALRFSTALLPLGENRFIGVDDLLAGTVFRFTKSEEGLTLELETIAGPAPLALLKK